MSEHERERKERKTYSPDPHRLLPQSPDAEKGVLSSFLIAPRDIGGFLAEQRVKEDWFAIPSHALIFRRLMQMWDMNEPIDFITLTQFLRDLGELDTCGGAAFITELFTFLPTAANCAYYAEILHEKWQLRSGIKTCTELASRMYDEQDDVPRLIDELERRILEIRATNRTKQISTKAAVIQALQQIEDLYARRGQGVTGLSTGFPEIDRITDGMHPTELIVIAARPSNGKTAIAMNIAEHLVLDHGKHVGVFSLEMSTVQLVQRMLCSRARVNLARVRDGFLSERDFPALQMAAGKLAESNLHIDEQGDLTIQELRAKARKMKTQFNVEAIFVDYLQLVRSSSKRAQDNRQLEVAEVSWGLKTLAKELEIPIVVLCQIVRAFEARAATGRPRLSDLRESGAIEQDADTVAFLVRPELYIEDDAEREAAIGKAEYIVAKQRNGPLGDVGLTFIKEYTRFETRACGDPDDSQPPLPV